MGVMTNLLWLFIIIVTQSQTMCTMTNPECDRIWETLQCVTRAWAPLHCWHQASDKMGKGQERDHITVNDNLMM